MIEEIGEYFPCVSILIFSYTLLVEPVALGDGSRFVISSKDCNSVFISHFESQEKTQSLN